jgi:toxin-antitoxin system PIN domain toxin
MILIDANLLLYAHNTFAPQNERAQQWLRAIMDSGEPIGLSWVTLLAILRITTGPRSFLDPMSVEEAGGIVTAWLAHPGVALLQPTERHWPILNRLLADGQARGPLVMDAHLAALAIEHGATLCTTDRDFTRFKGLRLLNPLE